MPTSASHSQAPHFTSGYGYQAAPEYICSPIQTQAPLSEGGYPYVPHNPTLSELKACESRIRSIKSRQASYSRYHTYRTPNSGNGGWAETGSTACTNESDEILHRVGSYGPTTGDSQLSEEDEESDGPETPFSSQRFLWREWVAGAPNVQGAQTCANPRDVFAPYKYSSAPTVDQPCSSPTDKLESLEDMGGDSGSEAEPAFDSLHSIAVHNKIKKIVYQFNSLVLGFKFPTDLEFAESTKAEEHSPELAHTSASKVIWEYNHKLEKLLEELDEIQSLGQVSVKCARKLAIDRLISEFEVLKEKQAMAWYNRQYERSTCRM